MKTTIFLFIQPRTYDFGSGDVMKTLDIRKMLCCITLCFVSGIFSVAAAQDSGGSYDDMRGREGFGGGRGGRGGPPGGDWGGRGGWSRGGDSVGQETPQQPTETVPVGLKAPNRITLDLPSVFASGDLDKDGQIGLYEWRQWKRGEMSLFLAFDHNGDGFLTPAELMKGPKAPTVPTGPGGPALASGSSAPAGRVPGVAAPGAPATPTPAAGASESIQMSAAAVSKSEGIFKLLDGDRNGSVDPAEWSKSSRIKGQFEAAGVDLSKPLPKEEFVNYYSQFNP
ncbi:hypothetical protein SH668x_000198 [Planctomicrobium sp. SH668]|uniref:hypothetical protein n=1 Tax=Planctomicrobium sp. SH668 TaxID=3448126 RepID=UPI003F5B56AD